MAYLLLENGKYFTCERFGATTDAIGELVFTTGVVGYPETLTDPAYAGQIIVQTFPLVGNYGIIDEDLTREPLAAGYVVRDWCRTPSNFRCDRNIDEYLKEKGIPAVSGIDTRELTRILREEGTMNALICDTLPESMEKLSCYKVTGAVESASRRETKSYAPEGEKLGRVVLLDYGVTDGEIRALTDRGCEVVNVPYDTTAAEILALSPDGILLSAGPGDPADYASCASVIAELLGKTPIYGIGLGHQLVAIAAGGKTYKLKSGHRGSNQPVKESDGSRTYITSQNHGYAVDENSLRGVAVATMKNANDNTCEALTYPGKMCFTTQFVPDSTPSAAGSAYLYDKFVEMIEENK